MSQVGGKKFYGPSTCRFLYGINKHSVVSVGGLEVFNNKITD
jgi:hypothetical protein